MQNDILMETDKGKVVLLVLLDLSAAFDTIVHKKKLLSIISNRCGFIGTTLTWFQSYLSERTQTVSIGSCHSIVEHLNYGVLQRPVFGPTLFSIYNSPLGEIIKSTIISIISMLTMDSYIYHFSQHIITP